MALKPVLSLQVQLAAGEEAEAARELRAQLPPEGWKILRQLAFEVTVLGESEAAGVTMVVVPAGEEAEALRALGLRAARL